MTEFGRLHLESWFRLRVVLFVLGLAVGLVLTRLEPRYPLSPVLVLEVGDLLASVAGGLLARHWGPARVVTALLSLDVLVNLFAVFYTGGLESGLGAMYAAVVLSALVLLGRRAAARFALYCALALLGQMVLDLAGVRAFPGVPSEWFQIVADVGLLLVLVLLAVGLARAGIATTHQLREAKLEAEAERAAAERGQAQWALINNVALHIQESTTRAAVYATIGAELERVGLHCALLEWAKPDVAMRVAYFSLPPEWQARVTNEFGVASDAVPLVLTQLPELDQAVRSGTPVLISPSIGALAPLLPAWTHARRAELVRAMDAEYLVLAPMRAGEQVSGVLAVFGGSLDGSDLAPFAALAQQVASALGKAEALALAHTRAAQLALVGEIAAQAAAFSDPDAILRTMVDLVQEHFGYQHVCVALYNAERQEIELRAVAGANAALFAVGERWGAAQGLIGLAARMRTTVISGDVHHDPRYRPDAEGARGEAISELCVPLISGDNVLGVLDVEERGRAAFDATDTAALETLAHQMAAALEKAHSLAAERRHAAQLETVRELALQLTAERELDPLLHAIVTSAEQLVRAKGAALYILDQGRGELVVRICQHLSRDYVGRHLRLGEGLAGRVAAGGEPLIVEDYSRWAGRASVYEAEPLARIMGVPLKWQERVLGVINLHRELAEPRFEQGDVRLAKLLGAQAAIALQNARLLDALQTRLQAQQTLSDLSGTLLKTTSPEAILKQAAAAALKVLDSESAVLLLPDDDGQLAARAHAGQVNPLLLAEALPPDHTTTAGMAFCTRHPAMWNEPEAGPSRHTLARRDGYRAGIAAPMLAGERALGVVLVNTRGERRYDATEAQTLALLANQTASALERAEYFEQVQKRARELDLLFEGFRATASTLEPDEVIARLLAQMTRALDVTSAYFIEAHNDPTVLVPRHEYYAAQAQAGERVRDEAKWAMRDLWAVQRVLARDVAVTQAADPRLSEDTRHYLQQYHVQTILRVPVVAAEQVLGCVSLWETRAARAWSADEIRFVQTMASQAAAALVNAQLYQAAQTRTRELQALYEASRQLNSSLDMRTLCENSVTSLRDILGYAHVGIYFVEDDVLRLQVQSGYDKVLDAIPLDQGMMARAVRTREIVHVPDVANEPDFLAALPDVRSEIAVPLMVGERVLGVLNVETRRNEETALRPERLSRADVQLLSTFANQLTASIENARLFHETEQRLVEVRTLHAASQAVNADLQLEAVLERVAHEFVGALDVDFCTLLEWEPGREELVVLFDLDPQASTRSEPGRVFPLAIAPNYRRALERRAPQVLHEDDPDPEVQAEIARHQRRSELLLPLINRGQLMGLVQLGDRRRRRLFTRDEIRLAESLAGQAAVSLKNARLYRDAQQRLQETTTLYQFAQKLGATLDIKALGSRALEAAGRLVNFDIGEVSVRRESDGALEPLVITGNPDLMPADPVVPRGVGIMGWVAEHRGTIRVGDVTRDPRYLPISSEILSEICLPLRVGERVIGVLNLEAKAPHAFDERAEQLLEVFANQLAIAVENARLYTQSKHDAEVRAVLLRELSHRVKNNLAAITSLLYMALDEAPETREQILIETLGRVQSMATAHALLAQSGEASVNLLELGRQVLKDTVHNLARPGETVEVQVSGDAVQVAARQTTTLALVLNELATNALRHGLGAEPNPALRFEVRAGTRGVEFHVEDNGQGLPSEFQLDAAAGLGLNLVRTLVEKDLHGRFGLAREAGWTCAEIQFELEDATP